MTEGKLKDIVLQVGKRFKTILPFKIQRYPYEKAICQALVIPVPQTEVEEITFDKLQSFESERGNGALGSSGK
jgi:dUTPase